MLKRVCSVLLLVFLAGSAAADTATEKIRARMSTLFPQETVTSIAKAQIDGLYEVMLGASLFYMSGDGRYVIRGDLIDLESKENISDRRRAQARRSVFAKMDHEDLIEFLPTSGKPRQTLYVYTDIDCGYCRKMHREVPTLNAAGIAVSYLAFPRSGLKGESFDKAVAVWCSADRKVALTEAKAGKAVSAPKCANPVAEQFELGRAMGVSGTPAVYTADGTQLGGYVPAAELIKLFK